MSEQPQEKPLERCSSNPHYEAHFGDSEQPQDTTGLPSCPSCGLIDGLHQDYCYYKAQPREWTYEYVKTLLLPNFGIAKIRAVMAAHNAALAAERGKLDAYAKQLAGTQSALIAVQKQRNDLIKQVDELIDNYKEGGKKA
jgi:hypothetical protein